MQLEIFIPDRLIEKYKRDRRHRRNIEDTLFIIRARTGEIITKLQDLNKLAHILAKRRVVGRPYKALTIIITNTESLIDATRLLEGDIIDSISAYKRLDLPELSEYLETNIKPVIESLLIKEKALLRAEEEFWRAFVQGTRTQEDFLEFLEQLEKAKLEILKELAELLATVALTRETLRHHARA